MTPEESKDLENDFANLARLSAAGEQEDVRLLLAKLVRKYKMRRPDFSERLNGLLKATHTRGGGAMAMRRASATALVPQTDTMPTDADTRMSLLRVFDDRQADLPAPLLSEQLTSAVQALVRERQEMKKLADHGISPSRSAILVGPPGMGKTLSARWIACQLNKPLWVLDLTTVMSSLLGKTGSNLRQVFEYAKASHAVLLLDEIDSIAKRRSDESDIGELKRLVTAILQEVDAWPDTSLLLAATNHAELIDPALWRRFDAILQFSTPSESAVEQGIRRFLGPHEADFGALISPLAAALQGTSLSDVERAVLAMRRHVLLDGVPPAQAVLRLVAQHLDRMDKSQRQVLAVELALTQTLSHNKIMELTGVSRDTIRKHAGPSPIRGRAGRKEV